MPRVYISIGSNIDREANIRSAIHVLQERFGELSLSSVYETEAVGFEGDDFYNLVAGFDTDESIESISLWLDEVENSHGRDRSAPKFGPRTLDMDLLLYGDVVSEEFRVPRDEIMRYAFVLGPLAELAPDLRHPVSEVTMQQSWSAFDQECQPMKKIDMELS
jgi:2-amino-4-hydroxy-6-hydroxymethyldihydropteridine diphosphokinase